MTSSSAARRRGTPAVDDVIAASPDDVIECCEATGNPYRWWRHRGIAGWRHRVLRGDGELLPLMTSSRHRRMTSSSAARRRGIPAVDDVIAASPMTSSSAARRRGNPCRPWRYRGVPGWRHRVLRGDGEPLPLMTSSRHPRMTSSSAARRRGIPAVAVWKRHCAVPVSRHWNRWRNRGIFRCWSRSRSETRACRQRARAATSFSTTTSAVRPSAASSVTSASASQLESARWLPVLGGLCLGVPTQPDPISCFLLLNDVEFLCWPAVCVVADRLTSDNRSYLT